MKCRTCSVEMFIDKVTLNDKSDEEIFSYKCPNPKCSNYGYQKENTNSNIDDERSANDESE